MRLKFFDYPGSTINLDDRFRRAHGAFSLWCLAEKVSPGLRSFSKHFFNMKTLQSAPWANCKGSDSIILLKWLSFVLKLEISNPTVAGHDQLLRNMLQVVNSALEIRMIHSHKLWLERTCAKALYVSILTCLRGYVVLGRSAVNLKIRAFLQKPKRHSLHHVGLSLKQQLQQGASLILNPQATACEMNEDYVGKISRLSRRIGFKLCDRNVITRYFIKFKILVKKRIDKTRGAPYKIWAPRQTWNNWHQKINKRQKPA